MSDVAVVCHAHWTRVAVVGTTLELHASDDGAVWRVLRRAELGEATPIVERALRALQVIGEDNRDGL